jgi:hypothetical protein
VAASPKLHQDIFDDYGDNGYLSPSNTLFEDSDDDAYTSEESADEREANDSDFNDTETKEQPIAVVPDTQLWFKLNLFHSSNRLSLEQIWPLQDQLKIQPFSKNSQRLMSIGADTVELLKVSIGDPVRGESERFASKLQLSCLHLLDSYNIY